MSASTSGPPGTTGAETRTLRLRAVLSAWAGFSVDSYSIYIASSVLLPALVYFQGDMSDETKAIFAGMTLAATLLGRPLGGMIFGHLADRIGRRLIGSITIYGFGVVSLLIACLPGAALVGPVTATTLLLVLRFVEGIFLGGEYTAATPMALEHAPAHRRGLAGGIVQCGANVGPLMVAAAMTLTLLVAPENGPDSPYVQWGWRLPFVFGFVLSVAVAWFLRRRVEESEVQKDAVAAAGTRRPSPLRTLLRGRSGRAFLQAWVTMTGVFFVVSLTGSVLNQFLLNNEGFGATDLANVHFVTAFAVLAYIFFGWLSDHIGRKRAIFIAATIALVLYPVTITAIGAGWVSGFWPLSLLALAVTALTVGPLGVLPAYINELFATTVRSTGWGVAYGTAVIIPSFFSYYMLWLSAFVPFVYTAGILAAFGMLLILAATLFGRETRGIDLRHAGDDEGKQPSVGETSSPMAPAGAVEEPR